MNHVLLTRRRLLSASSLSLLPAVSACDQIAQRFSTKPQFKAIDITGANWASGFALTGTDGKPRQLADFKGKLVTLFFGFLNCPDFCPSHLARQVEVLKLLGPQASNVQTVFISVDPERDTPANIDKYLAAFHPSFIGLTGTQEQLKATAREFKAFFEKVELKGSASTYAVDHTTNTTVFDSAGRVRLMMRHELTAADVAHDLKLLLNSAA
jgi:protein SCO1